MLIISSKNKRLSKIFCIVVMIGMGFCLLGCNKNIDKKADSIMPMTVSPIVSITPTTKMTQNFKVEDNTALEETVPDIEKVDYKDCFEGMKGCAVFLNRDTNVYTMYNEKLCEKRTSPCSTFKIIATLMGIDSGVVKSIDFTMGYDGTVYPTDKWNKDLSLKDAFSESCVWYFRKVIDQVGQSKVQSYLDQLEYGNCDISEWEGSGINSLPELNGFWLESSLEISPIEQVDVLANIFNVGTAFSKKSIEMLKEVMLTQKVENISVYGKTGTGQNYKTKHRDNGWFVGMFQSIDEEYYFAVHLTDSKNEVTGPMAKDIALKIIKQYYSDK